MLNSKTAWNKLSPKSAVAKCKALETVTTQLKRKQQRLIDEVGKASKRAREAEERLAVTTTIRDNYMRTFHSMQ